MSVRPVIEFDSMKLKTNASKLATTARTHGVELVGVTKAVRGHPALAHVLLEAGIGQLADSRLDNLLRMRRAGIRADLMLIRSPTPKQAEETVALADVSLNSELSTLAALSRAAIQQKHRHRVILMVELGDQREGVQPDNLADYACAVEGLDGLRLEGIGANFTCFMGVVPTVEHMKRLANLARGTEEVIRHPLRVISGGNSSSIPALLRDNLVDDINQLRVGEGILLGKETASGTTWKGAYDDAIRIGAPVIEFKQRSAAAGGPTGPHTRWQALAAIGRQDVDTDGLQPLDSRLRVLGANSDHLVLEVTEAGVHLHPGDTVWFRPTYGALMTACASPYIQQRWR